MLFMVVESFKPGKAAEIYRRFRAQGRMERTSADAAAKMAGTGP